MKTAAISSKVAVPPGVSPDLYRTKMCNFFKRGDPCNYKEKCFFAHGDKELRALVRSLLPLLLAQRISNYFRGR